MKQAILLALASLCAGLCFSQTPQSIQYQAIARDAAGDPVALSPIDVHFNIKSGSAIGPTVYSETQSVLTSELGLFTCAIGDGTPMIGVWVDIGWPLAPHYLNIQMDLGLGGGLQDMGTSQMLSVPYAFYAEESGNGTKWSSNGDSLYYNAGPVGIGTSSPLFPLTILDTTFAESTPVAGFIGISNNPGHGSSIGAIRARGTELAIDELLYARDRIGSFKAMVLLSDGQPNAAASLDFVAAKDWTASSKPVDLHYSTTFENNTEPIHVWTVSYEGKLGMWTDKPRAPITFIDSVGDLASIYQDIAQSMPLLIVKCAPSIALGRAAGTPSAPIFLEEGKYLGSYEFMAYQNLPDNINRYGYPSAAIRSSTTEAQTASALGGNLEFHTTENGTTETKHRMTIDHNGNIGVGTHTPSALVTVWDSTNHSATSGNAMFMTWSDRDSLGSDIFLLKSRGTPSAPAPLQFGDHLGGLYGMSDPEGNDVRRVNSISIKAETSEDHDWSGGKLGSRWLISTIENGTKDAQDRMTIDHNGNVGIGVASPSGLITVVDSTNKGATSDMVDLLTWTAVDTIGSSIVLGKSRGTPSAPLPLEKGDVIGGIYVKPIENDGTPASEFAAGMELAADLDWIGGDFPVTYGWSSGASGGTNPAKIMTLDSEGDLGLGTSEQFARLTVADSIDSGSNKDMIDLLTWSNVDSLGSSLVLGRSRGTPTSFLPLQNGDRIGSIGFAPTLFKPDGIPLRAKASATLKATIVKDDVGAFRGSKITISTTKEGDAAPTDRLTINDDGNITFGTWDGSASKVHISDDETNAIQVKVSKTAVPGSLNSGWSFAHLFGLADGPDGGFGIFEEDPGGLTGRSRRMIFAPIRCGIYSDLYVTDDPFYGWSDPFADTKTTIATSKTDHIAFSRGVIQDASAGVVKVGLINDPNGKAGLKFTNEAIGTSTVKDICRFDLTEAELSGDLKMSGSIGEVDTLYGNTGGAGAGGRIIVRSAIHDQRTDDIQARFNIDEISRTVSLIVTDELTGSSSEMNIDPNTNSWSTTGMLIKGGGTFKIDHPLDPENTSLSHSFVESPDMMNVYNGNAITDEKGFATVTMPDYFEALNKDFRYQLTVIGKLAHAAVIQEIYDNKFKIQSSEGNTKVSWQVTGVRRDEFADENRVVVEQKKK